LFLISTNYWFYNVCGRRQRKWFTSIPSIYWTIVTLTTVGYGDISPETPLGQFIASFVMILGYGIIAVAYWYRAEIAKSTQNKTDKKPCGCGTEDYPENANFALIVDIRLTLNSP
jgi:voltage-gated potassium channel